MHVVLGANGHIGSAVARALLEADETVTVILHDDARSSHWSDMGADVAIADVRDVDALRDVFRCGSRAFVLNPPADPSTDTDLVERDTAAVICRALRESELEKVVAASTYGAQPGERIGDLGVLYEFEQTLQSVGIPVAINRGAYYFTNWDISLATARDNGVVQTMLPADLVLPTVDPSDLGTAAARRMVTPADDNGVNCVEGPRRYSPDDVAGRFARVLGHEVTIDAVPQDRWIATYRQMGFSDAAADSYARMTKRTVDHLELPPDPQRCATTLDTYISRLVRNQPSTK